MVIFNHIKRQKLEALQKEKKNKTVSCLATPQFFLFFFCMLLFPPTVSTTHCHTHPHLLYFKMSSMITISSFICFRLGLFCNLLFQTSSQLHNFLFQTGLQYESFLFWTSLPWQTGLQYESFLFSTSLQWHNFVLQTDLQFQGFLFWTG